MSTRYCIYCCKHKPSGEFKLLARRGSKSSPRYMCFACIDTRRKPREERDALVAIQKEERKNKI